MKKLFILIFLFSHQLSFGQCKDPTVKMLKGVWVRDAGPADTIKFAMTLDSDYRFELILADRTNPQGGLFGPYEYRTLGTTMIVRSFLSSYSGAQAISFFMDRSGQLLTLGNFYSLDTEDKTLTFRKVK